MKRIFLIFGVLSLFMVQSLAQKTGKSLDLGIGVNIELPHPYIDYHLAYNHTLDSAFLLRVGLLGGYYNYSILDRTYRRIGTEIQGLRTWIFDPIYLYGGLGVRYSYELELNNAFELEEFSIRKKHFLVGLVFGVRWHFGNNLYVFSEVSNYGLEFLQREERDNRLPMNNSITVVADWNWSWLSVVKLGVGKYF